jgi:hypothetical protein
MTRELHLLLPVMTFVAMLEGQVSESQSRPPIKTPMCALVSAPGRFSTRPRNGITRTGASVRRPRRLQPLLRLEKATDEVSGNFEHRSAAMQEVRFVILIPRRFPCSL